MREAPPLHNGGREILPKTLKPTHYNLVVEPDFENSVEFEGSIVIDLHVVEETSSITLNASADLKILKTEVVAWTKQGEVNGARQELKIQVYDTKYDATRQELTIALGSTLKLDQTVKLAIKYKGNHVHNSLGFYRAPFKGPDGSLKVFSSYNFH